MRRNWHYPFLIVLLCIAFTVFSVAAWAVLRGLIPPPKAILLVAMFALFILIIIVAFLALMRH